MPVISAQTRLQLEKSIGWNLNAIHVGTTTDTGNTTTVNDTTLWGGTNNHKGKWVHVSSTSGPTGEIRRVASNDTSVALTVLGAFSSNSTSSMEYILWDEDYNPKRIQDFISRVVHTVTRKGAPPLEDTSLHTGGQMYTFSLKSCVAGIQSVQTRQTYTGESLLTCDNIWDESSDTSMVTIELDGEDYREGSGSCRFTLLAAGDTATVLATDSISATDMSGYTHIEFWTKMTSSAADGALQLLLDNSTGCTSPTESLNIPQTDSAIWTHHRVALANPWNDTAIVSIGLQQPTDVGATTVWLDDIRASKSGSETWEQIHPTQWRLDNDNRKLVFNSDAYAHAAYSLLKIVGVKKPTELTSDTSICDIDPEYVIEAATAIALRARGDRTAERRDAAWLEAERREGLAQLRMNSLMTPRGVRWLSD